MKDTLVTYCQFLLIRMLHEIKSLGHFQKMTDLILKHHKYGAKKVIPRTSIRLGRKSGE